MESSLLTPESVAGSLPERTKCEVWTRVMGYFRPISGFNTGKRSEFYSREFYKEPDECELIIDENKRFIEQYSTDEEKES